MALAPFLYPQRGERWLAAGETEWGILNALSLQAFWFPYRLGAAGITMRMTPDGFTYPDWTEAPASQRGLA